jgi:spore maturation protein CgeB
LRVIIFCHSLASDWNHGNAHFLRGITSELLSRGHDVDVWEPSDAWSARNLAESEGPGALEAWRNFYPGLSTNRYDFRTLDLDQVLGRADLVLVHEWNDTSLVSRIGDHHRRHPSYRLFFHDTHHRAVSNPKEMSAYDLSGYDGVLAFGESLRRRHISCRPKLPAWTWHEAADTRVFKPRAAQGCAGDLVWIGNWGDEERTAELTEFLLQPASRLGLRTEVYGVRYPVPALQSLEAHQVRYRGWLPNFRVPEVFARFAFTVHVPRRFYVHCLPGIPTVRVFEALACGIPLVSAPWDDCEGLFQAGRDYLIARDGEEMADGLRELRADLGLRARISENGLAAIRANHTCAHRVDELLEIART